MKVWGVRPMSMTWVLLLALAQSATAQYVPADALLATGRVADAESLYFLRAAQRPRDPVARMALGRYLGARGALRVGAVLLEEARDFGGDARTLAFELAPLYRGLNDFRALATLPASPLSAEERAQAALLVSYGQTMEMADSVVIGYRAPTDTGTMGRVRFAIGETEFDAVIDPRRSGIVLDTSRRTLPAVSLVDLDGRTGTLGVIERVRFGDAQFGNVPVAIEPLGSATRAIVGLDVVRGMAPTFDPVRGQLVLRRTGRVAPARRGVRVPTLITSGGVRVLRDRRFFSLTGKEMRSILVGRRWTLDSKRGEIVLE